MQTKITASFGGWQHIKVAFLEYGTPRGKAGKPSTSSTSCICPLCRQSPSAGATGASCQDQLTGKVVIDNPIAKLAWFFFIDNVGLYCPLYVSFVVSVFVANAG
jgi:hypothetical protein